MTADALVTSPLFLSVGCFVLALAAVYVVRREAVRRQVLDIPNERSSHSTPTPRGGGLGAVVVLAAAWFVTIAAGRSVHGAWLLLCVAAMAAVAAVGWLDDTRGLGVRSRFAVHVVAAATVGLLGLHFGWPWLLAAFWTFWVVSSINVVNFMDGIDGLIASQTVVAALAMAQLAPDGGLAQPFALALAAAAAGFLVWNWPPARIFMGDVGSGSLGFALVLVGALVVAEARTDIVRTFLPLYPLFLDATCTIIRRARRGERITTAHRSHLYQRLANGGWGHARVTLLFGAAAVVGALIARVDAPAVRWPLAGLYGIAVLALGMTLDRRADRLASSRQIVAS